MYYITRREEQEGEILASEDDKFLTIQHIFSEKIDTLSLQKKNIVIFAHRLYYQAVHPSSDGHSKHTA